jgi:hypothetical protein
MATTIVEIHGVLVRRRTGAEQTPRLPRGRRRERITFPVEPLLELLGHHPGALTKILRCSGVELTTARTLGWTWKQADRYAVRAGYHPAEVWPDLWRQLNEEVAA